ncbi:MAG TPA: hypothetical protein ENI95_00515 [Chloroflexi bacterium]|nr:hypothetical protein [Chloroflexota bacterium]
MRKKHLRTRRIAYLPVGVALALMVSASLACNGPRQEEQEEVPPQPAEATVEPPATQPPATPETPPETVLPSPEPAGEATAFPTPTPIVAAPTATPTEATGESAEAEALGDQLESLLGLLDQANNEADPLDDVPELSD